MKSLSGERWRRIRGYRDYLVSSLGRVLSLKYDKKRILLPGTEGGGYRNVVLCKYGTRATFLVHRLVAIAFIANNKNLPQVNHKDGNKSNNAIDNLEWVTALQNTQHAIAIGIHAPIGESHGMAKLSEKDVRAIRVKYATKKYTQQKLSVMYGVKVPAISAAIRRRNWKHVE